MNNLTVVVPFFEGYETIDKLISSLPEDIPIIIVDDLSNHPLTQKAIDRQHESRKNIEVIRLETKQYFAGGVNRGIQECETDVLVLNQDTWFDNREWCGIIDQYRERYAFIGERIKGIHPSFGELGYIHGTFAYFRRDALNSVGLLNAADYPLWGNTAEWQWRAARKNFQVLPLKEIPGFNHERKETERYGSSIKNFLDDISTKEKEKFIHTPPLLSVIVPNFNYGVYIQDCINSLIGGSTSLGEMPGQTLHSFEVIIVDDASTDNSWELIQAVTDISKGIRSYRLKKNVGTARALNFGIEKAVGKYITFLSADDMRESFSLEKLVEACEQNPHSFAYDDVWLTGKRERIKKWKIEEYDFEKLIWKNQIHAGIVFPKKAWEDVGGYPDIMEDGREDWAFNVALGVHGWCGVHVHQYGYLYRREGQNRTEHNTTERHRQQFLGKIMSLFPSIYKGERPMACCGKGGSKAITNNGASSNNFTMGGSARMAMDVGKVGMVKIEYLGQKMGSTWHGDVTNAPYEFGKDRKRGWVDKRDLGDREEKKGFLSKKDSNGNWIFKVVTGEKAEEVKQPEVVVVEEPVLVSEAVSEISEEPHSVTLVDNPNSSEFVAPGAFSNAVASGTLTEVAAKKPKKKAVVDPSEMTVEQLKALALNREEWEEVYRLELAGRSRKGLILFLEEKLAELS